MKYCLLLFMVVASVAFSQDLSLYQKKIYRNSKGDSLPYRILYPENYDKTKKYPLILFLHGAGERGNDNEKQLVHGSSLLLKEENRKKYAAIVVFPQCPQETYWCSVKIDLTKTPVISTFDYKSDMTPPLRMAIDLTKETLKNESVDDKRVYICGLSMGGMGTFEAVYRFPKTFAAAAPICGGADAKSYKKKQTKTSFWIFHGDKDNAVDVANSRIIYKRLKELKADVKYSEYENVGHDSWNNAFAEPDFLDWMFSKHR